MRGGMDAAAAEQHAFLDLAKEFDWDGVRAALEESPALVNVDPSGRWPALHQAALGQDPEAVEMLLGFGADPLSKNSDGETPRDLAENVEVRRLLEAAEAEPEPEPEPVATSATTQKLIELIYRGVPCFQGSEIRFSEWRTFFDWEIVGYVDTPEGRHSQFLLVATDTFEEATRLRSRLDEVGDLTPLYAAARFGWGGGIMRSMMKTEDLDPRILSEDSYGDASYTRGLNPIAGFMIGLWEKLSGQGRWSKEGLERVADLNRKAAEDELKATEGEISSLEKERAQLGKELLLHDPADRAVAALSEERQHAFLNLAKVYDWSGVRKALVASPALVNVDPSGRWPALHQAAHGRNQEAVKMLLGFGADPLSKNSDGDTPRDLAENVEVRQLLEAEETRPRPPKSAEVKHRLKVIGKAGKDGLLYDLTRMLAQLKQKCSETAGESTSYIEKAGAALKVDMESFTRDFSRSEISILFNMLFMKTYPMQGVDPSRPLDWAGPGEPNDFFIDWCGQVESLGAINDPEPEDIYLCNCGCAHRAKDAKNRGEKLPEPRRTGRRRGGEAGGSAGGSIKKPWHCRCLGSPKTHKTGVSQEVPDFNMWRVPTPDLNTGNKPLDDILRRVIGRKVFHLLNEDLHKGHGRTHPATFECWEQELVDVSVECFGE